MVKRNVLLNPGPITTSNAVKKAQIVPDICPREEEFSKILFKISDDLVKISGGDENYVCILIGGSGTAAMDSVINSAVHKKALIINNGAYGERFAKIAKTYDIDFEEVKFHLNSPVDISIIEKILSESPDIGYVVMVHHETTTGILNPITEAGKIAKKYNCVFIVDAISSLGGIPLSVINSNIDFLISTSNKCLEGLPGISFVIAKKSELEKLKSLKRKSFYLNLYDQYAFFNEFKQSQFTPPVQVIYSFKKAIEEFLKEGSENRYLRYKKSHNVLIKGMEKLGFTKFLNNVEESNLLTTFFEPEDENYSFKKMHDLLYEKGFTIYPGKINEKTFRIANLGAISSRDIKNFLKAMELTINEMGLNLRKKA